MAPWNMRDRIKDILTTSENFIEELVDNIKNLPDEILKKYLTFENYEIFEKSAEYYNDKIKKIKGIR